MSDLIDREALLRQIDIDSEGEPGYYGDTWKFIDTIKRMPSAQPEPSQVARDIARIVENEKDMRILPKRGRWIHDGSKWTNRWICSECGYKWFFDCIEGAYCPNCGADMRGEQNE